MLARSGFARQNRPSTFFRACRSDRDTNQVEPSVVSFIPHAHAKNKRPVGLFQRVGLGKLTVCSYSLGSWYKQWCVDGMLMVTPIARGIANLLVQLDTYVYLQKP